MYSGLVDVPRCCSYFSIGKIHELTVMLLYARGYYSDAVAISGEKFSMAERSTVRKTIICGSLSAFNLCLKIFELEKTDA